MYKTKKSKYRRNHELRKTKRQGTLTSLRRLSTQKEQKKEKNTKDLQEENDYNEDDGIISNISKRFWSLFGY